MHARRKFDEATGSSPREATEMLGLVRLLYRIEKRGRDLADEERLKLRREEAGPVLSRIFERAGQRLPDPLPKSPLGQALTYLLNQSDPLQRYLRDGRLRTDNNLAENAIRPLALGRNYAKLKIMPSCSRIDHGNMLTGRAMRTGRRLVA
jgi:hypothetical protein